MRKRRKVLIGCGYLAAVIVVLTWPSRDEGPRYKGRALGEWVEMYAFGPRRFRAEAAEAIAVIGTNALPYLMAWTDYEFPRWKSSLGTAIRRMPYWIQKFNLESWVAPGKAQDRATASSQAFGLLRGMADPVIPELERRVVLKNSPGVRDCAVEALMGIGSQAAIEAITSQDLDPHARKKVALLVAAYPERLGTNSARMIRWLLEHAVGTKGVVRGASPPSFAGFAVCMGPGGGCSGVDQQTFRG